MRIINKIASVAQIADLEKMGVIIEFTPENEDLEPFGYFDDDETAQEICDKYNSGSEAAWFCAKVEVSVRDISGTDYLGGCSYASFKEFQSDESGYYVDMINQCIEQINSDIEAHNFEVQKSWDIRRAVNLVKPYGYNVFQAVWPSIKKAS